MGLQAFQSPEQAVCYLEVIFPEMWVDLFTVYDLFDQYRVTVKIS